ncbi:MAG: hypothetical protein J7647_10500 [Cyanobacteria bacterium SBLK]|nr:hypothetical protein [Cyanobacteria bacterium SBLK]
MNPPKTENQNWEFGLQQRSRRHKLAWLGILSPDAAIAPRMVTTLWEVEEAEAREILEDFGDRGLLQQQELADGTQSFSLPDTVGDLAREFLVASRGGDRDGLGFIDLAEAHGILLTRYQSQTERRLWHTLPNDGYIYEHLTWHLEQAKWFEELHELFQEETEWGNNGWYVACERIDREAGFLEDMARAWRFAEDLFEDHPRRAIALQVRYLLIATSINSLTDDIPAGIIAAFVEKGIWTPMQGLKRAERCSGKIEPQRPCGNDMTPLPDPLKLSPRGLAWVALMPSLSESLLLRVLEASSQWYDESRLMALLNNADLYPIHWRFDLISRTLERVRNIEDSDRRLEQLTSLARDRLPEALLPPVLEEEQQAELFSALVSHLPQHLLPRVLEVARQLRKPYPRAKTLSAIAPYLRETLPQALEAVRQLDSEYQRAELLSDLALHFRKIFPQALEAVRQLDSEYQRAELLCTLARHWRKIVPKIYRATQNRERRPKVLRFLRRYFRDLLSETIDTVLQFESEFPPLSNQNKRFSILQTLASSCPEVVPRVFEIACQLAEDRGRDTVLLAIAPHIPEHLLPRALEIAPQMYRYRHAEFLGTLAINFPEVLPQALETIRTLEKGQCVRILNNLACHYPDILPEALEAIALQRLKTFRASFLSRLACDYPEIVPQALETISLLQGNKREKAEMLNELAPHIPTHLLPQALRTANPDWHPYRQAGILTALACHFREFLPQALEAAQHDQDHQKAEILSTLASCYPEIIPQVLELARQLPKDYQSWVWSVLTRHDPKILSEALELARPLESDQQARRLTTLACHYPEILPDALEVVNPLELFWRSHLLNNLASHYPEIVPQAVEAACQLKGVDRVDRLNALAPLLPKNLLPRVLESARLLDEHWRNKLMNVLAHHHPEIIPQILDLAPQLQHSFQRLLWNDIAPHRPEVVLEAISQSKDENAKVEAFEKLLPHLPERLIEEALEEIRQLRDRKKQAKILVLFVKHKPIFSLWCKSLHLLDRCRRQDLLEGLPELIPAIVSLSGTEETLNDVARAIQDVRRQWP